MLPPGGRNRQQIYRYYEIATSKTFDAIKRGKLGRHSIQPDGNQHIDNQHNDIQHNAIQQHSAEQHSA